MTTLASVSPSNTAATYGSGHVHRLHPARRHHDDDEQRVPKVERSDGPGRRNPLVNAMMSALQGLMPAQGTTPAAPAADTAPAPAPTDATATPTTASTAANPADTLRDAAYAFAHALYDALRGGGDGRRGEGRHRHDDDHGHHRHGRHGGGYGNLAERLTALATRLEGSVVTPTPTPTPTPIPAPAPAPVATTPLVAEAPAVAAPAPASPTLNITININFGRMPAANDAPSQSPLVDAFKNLLSALGNGGDAASSPTERLTAFLRQMAQSLSSREDAAAPATPASGGLLNVSA